MRVRLGGTCGGGEARGGNEELGMSFGRGELGGSTVRASRDPIGKR